MQIQIQTYLEYIKGICPLLAKTELDNLAPSLSIRELKKGDYFIRAGELQKDLGFIIKGLVRSYCIDTHGDEQTMRFMTDRQFVSNYAALLS